MELTLTAGFWIIFCIFLVKWYAPVITAICFIVLLIDRHNDQLLPLLRQFLLTPNTNNKSMDPRMNYPTPCLNSVGIWSIPGVLWLFSFSISNSTSKALGSGTSGSAVRNSACLTSPTARILNSWAKWFLHPANYFWQSATKSPFSSFTIVVLGW